jgi:hypothetical protein
MRANALVSRSTPALPTTSMAMLVRARRHRCRPGGGDQVLGGGSREEGREQARAHALLTSALFGLQEKASSPLGWLEIRLIVCGIILISMSQGDAFAF